MTRWLFRIVPWVAGGNASATCLKILLMRPAVLHASRLVIQLAPVVYLASVSNSEAPMKMMLPQRLADSVDLRQGLALAR